MQHAFPTRSDMSPKEAMAALFGICQAMQAIVDLGRFDTAYGDAAQNIAYLIQVLTSQLTDVYVALSADAEDVEDGNATLHGEKGR